MAPAFITNFIEEWRSLTNWCKGLLIVSIVQTIILIGFSIASMVIFALTLSIPQDVNKEIAYGLLVIVSSIFFIYFAFDAVMNENKFEMLAFAAVSILLTVRIIFQTYSGFTRVEQVVSVTWLTLAVMICVCVFQVLLIIFFIRAWRDFGWKLYKTVGANKNLIAYFRHYQIFLSLMKVDLQFGVSLVMLAGFFLFTATTSVALWLNVGVIVLSFIWAFLGWFMVTRELRVGMIVVFAFAVAEPAYILYKILAFYAPSLYPPSENTDCTYSPCILFTVSGIIAIVVRVAVVVFAVQCMRNFDRGMKKVFGTDGGKEDPAAKTATSPASSFTMPTAGPARPGSFSSIALSTSSNPRVTMTTTTNPARASLASSRATPSSPASVDV